MRKAVIITASAIIAGGLLTAAVSARYVSATMARDFVEAYVAVDGGTRPIILPAEAVGSVAIPKDLLEETGVQHFGVLGAILTRSHRGLPIHEIAVAKPRVWVSCHSRVVGPFLLLTDVDGAWELRGATHQTINRTLRLAFGSRSVEICSWGTGAMYHQGRVPRRG